MPQGLAQGKCSRSSHGRNERVDRIREVAGIGGKKKKKPYLETWKERNGGQPKAQPLTSLGGSFPFSHSLYLFMKPASDVHREVGVPSESIAPLAEGVHLAHCPGGLLRRQGGQK